MRQKLFWVSDLALHVALGWPYRARRVEAGAVVYVTCEGQSGFSARIEAFRRSKLAHSDNDPLPDPPFFLLPTRLDLVGETDALIADISAQLAGAGCILIVIDTLNRSLIGSESKDEDMSAYVRACDRLREAFKCAVIIVHHCGTNDQRPRGHTSLTGAADAQIEVKRDKASNIVATVEFMKDGPEGDKIINRLAAVDVGTDEDGELITSCILEPSDEMPQSSRAKSLSGQAGIAFRLAAKRSCRCRAFSARYETFSIRSIGCPAVPVAQLLPEGRISRGGQRRNVQDSLEEGPPEASKWRIHWGLGRPCLDRRAGGGQGDIGVQNRGTCPPGQWGDGQGHFL
jgi:hypothetical protein